MLYINDSSSEIKSAKKEHLKITSKYLKSHHRRGSDITNFIHDNLEDILIGNPKTIIILNNQFYDSLTGHTSKSYFNYINVIYNIDPKSRTSAQKKLVTRYVKLHGDINKVINYENWFITSKKKYDYQLANNLNRNTCTYCNRTYTSTLLTINGKKLMRPQFDHWFPKAKYPLLALSFYNLIPSCSICNSSVKSDTDFTLGTHIHPYIDDIIDDFSFNYEFRSIINNYEITIETNIDKVKKTFEDLHIAETYSSHQIELNDLIKTKKAYSKSYLKTLKQSFPLANLSDNEIYRLAFGVEFDKNDYHRLPLSKFKKDILQELKIID